VEEPLITSYVFVHTEEKQFGQLKKLDGILHLVCWLGKPAVIKAEEIAVIRQFLQEHKNVHLEKVPIQLYDTVKITQGSFVNQQGTIVALQNNSIKVALPSLGYVMYAVLEKSSVEKIK
jgi:transcription antitermination factor NusG